MLNLSAMQKDFLESELNITCEQIEKMNIDEWQEVRFKCYDIVLDEMLDENDNYNPSGDGSERCSIASSIMDTMYKDLRD